MLACNSFPRHFRSSRKHPRTARRPLSFEALEERALLAGSIPALSVGIEGGGFGWASTADMFANVMNQAKDVWYVGTWSSLGLAVGSLNDPLPNMDQNGYPIGLGNLQSKGEALYTTTLAGLGANGSHYPLGTYTLTFDGHGTVSVMNNGKWGAQFFSQNGGIGSPFNVNITGAPANGITLAITSSDPADYVRNIRLVMPGLQNTYQTNPFNPLYLSTIQPFSTIRVAGMILTDFGSRTDQDGQSGPLTWNDVSPPSYRTQTTQTGVDVQYLVQLANLTHANLWVNMPVNGDISYETNFAQYVKQNLDPDLKVYVEYGIEIWNGAFSYEFNMVNTYAQSKGINIPTAMADLSTANCWSIWSQVFAGETDRMVRVVATQMSPSMLGLEVTELARIASPDDLNHGFDIVSGAPYFVPNTSSFNASTTVSDIETALMASLYGSLQPVLQAWMNETAVLEAKLNRPIPSFCYEGDPALTDPANMTWWNAYIAAQTDPGMYSVVMSYLDLLNAEGFQGICYTNFVSNPNPAGEWGSMEYMGQPSTETPKYNALVDFAESPKLGISGLSASETAGATESFTVSAYNPNGEGIDTNYSGTVTFSSTDPQATLPADYTFTAADQGVHTFTGIFKTAGQVSIVATDLTSGIDGVQSGIAVHSAQAQNLIITNYAGGVFVGVTNGFTVTLYDAYGNVATSYAGTVRFTSSGPTATLPPDYTFTLADKGVHSFTAILDAFGAQTITAADANTPAITGSASTTVKPFVTWDRGTQGNWIGAYGGQGYGIAGGGTQFPAYANVTLTGTTTSSWASGTADQRDLQTAGGSSRSASYWSAPSSFTVGVSQSDGNRHDIGLYFLDGDGSTRSEQIQLIDVATGAVVDTETVSMFNAGIYLNLSLSGSVLIQITRLSGSNAVLSGLFIDVPHASASLLETDPTTQGNWIGTYGAQGYDLINNATSMPAYATVTPSGQYSYTWTASTTDSRALQRVSGPSRIAAGWVGNGNSFSIDVNLLDGQAHDLALYAVDWDSRGRSEKIQISSAASGTVLDTQTISSFSSGTYLQWVVTGHVVITITRLLGPNAILNGLFFDPAPIAATSLAVSSASSNFGQAITLTANVAAPKAGLPSPTGTVGFFDGGIEIGSAMLDRQGSASLKVTNESVGDHSLHVQYFGDKAYVPSSSANINETVAPAATTTSLAVSSPTSNFGQAVILTANVGAPNAGLPSPTGPVAFFDGSSEIGSAMLGSQGSASLTVTKLSVGVHSLNVQYLGDTNYVASSSANINETVAPAGSNASFVQTDTTTQGSWRNAYGADGYDIATDTSFGNPKLPSYATLGITGASTWTWAASTTDVRALQNSANIGQIAAAWYSSTSMSFNLNLNDGQSHEVSLYAVDWDNKGRSELVQIIDPTTGKVLDTEAIGQFQGGAYLTWNLTGNLVIKVTSVGAANAVVSGLFFGGKPTSIGSAHFLGTNTTTQGNWHGAYGAQGYDLALDSSAGNPKLPAYVTMGITGASTWTWAASTTDVRALQNSANSGRIAAGWYSKTSMSFALNLTDGQSHKVSLYAVDYDNTVRNEQIQIIDSVTGAVLDTETISSFHGGAYLSWNLTGQVVVKVTNLNPNSNAVVSGLFFG
jgi:hypothetical protein